METTNTETIQFGCDKGAPDSLCVGLIAMATCPKCGKTYRRCVKHGAIAGAMRSLGSHKGLVHFGGY